MKARQSQLATPSASTVAAPPSMAPQGSNMACQERLGGELDGLTSVLLQAEATLDSQDPAALVEGEHGGGAGVPLPADVKDQMEGSFDADFSNVRIKVAEEAEGSDVKAWAEGTDIHVAPDALDLSSQEGLELIGHELAHVVSQETGEASGEGLMVDNNLEAKADEAGRRAARGESAVEGGGVKPSGSSGVAQPKLAGNSGVLKAQGGGQRGWRKGAFTKLRHALSEYESKERMGYPASVLLPMLEPLEQQALAWRAEHVDQVASGDQTAVARDRALATLLPRLRAERRALDLGEGGPSRDDASLVDHADNAVGGALNKLDRIEYADGMHGFYKPEASGAQGRSELVGIPEANPNYSGRSVASNRVDQLLSRTAGTPELLARSEFATHTRSPQNEDGSLRPATETTGLYMVMAPGDEMRGELIGGDNLALTEAAEDGQTRIDDPVLLRSLNNLQWLDAICGQIDRHNANFFIERAADGSVLGVTGIDNDMAFGAGQVDAAAPVSGLGDAAPYKGLPHMADRAFADAILAMTVDDLIGAVGDLLSDEEVQAAAQRLDQVKTRLGELDGEGRICTHDEWSTYRRDIASDQMESDQENYIQGVAKEVATGRTTNIEAVVRDAWAGYEWAAPFGGNAPFEPLGDGVARRISVGDDIPAAAVNYVARKAVEIFNTRVYDMIEEATGDFEQGTRDYRDAMVDAMGRASIACVRAAAEDIPGPGALAMINANDDVLRANVPELDLGP